MGKNEIKPIHRIARGILFAILITGVISVSVLVIGFIGFEVMGRQAESTVGNFKPETSELGDGVYYGEYKAFDAFIFAEVEFEIADGSLIDVTFTRLLQTPGHSAGEEVRGRIAESGDLRFDTVTGATRTSGFAKAAIKDAVEQGPTMEYETGLLDIDFR